MELKKNNKIYICDKCDGNHLTDYCPIFKKPRENHPDAQKRNSNVNEINDDNNFFIDNNNVKIIKQPGDGSCLFHSISFGLGNLSSSELRIDIANWIKNNPDIIISDSPLRDWIYWDSNNTVDNYAKKISVSGWGGAIEIIACSILKNVSIHVYEKIGSNYKRISSFNQKKPSKLINILYTGGVHYDSLIIL